MICSFVLIDKYASEMRILDLVLYYYCWFSGVYQMHYCFTVCILLKYNNSNDLRVRWHLEGPDVPPVNNKSYFLWWLSKLLPVFYVYKAAWECFYIGWWLVHYQQSCLVDCSALSIYFLFASYVGFSYDICFSSGLWNLNQFIFSPCGWRVRPLVQSLFRCISLFTYQKKVIILLLLLGSCSFFAHNL